MKKIIVLNHKMSLLYDELYNYIESVNNIDTDNDIIICPSSIYLEAFVNNSYWLIGSQNINYNTDTKHTGEISTDQLKQLGIEYCLIGHYERIRDFRETPSIINSKLIASLDANILPILCFGEDLEEDYKVVLPRLLDSYLKDISNIEFIIFAYEPIYACGSGILPSIDKIKEITTYISEYLENKYHTKAKILYGGSVSSDNASDIINIDSLSGLLVGDISSNAHEVSKLISKI